MLCVPGVLSSQLNRGLCRERRGNLNVQDEMTALMWAARMGHTDCVRLLVKGGAEMNARDTVRVRRCRGSLIAPLLVEIG